MKLVRCSKSLGAPLVKLQQEFVCISLLTVGIREGAINGIRRLWYPARRLKGHLVSERQTIIEGNVGGQLHSGSLDVDP